MLSVFVQTGFVVSAATEPGVGFGVLIDWLWFLWASVKSDTDFRGSDSVSSLDEIHLALGIFELNSRITLSFWLLGGSWGRFEYFV